MRFERSSGILVHPTSFPGTHGIGDLGAHAFAFVDWLAAAGQHLWQVLPLGPTGFGNSPYASPSAFAGNPLVISLDLLHQQGLLTEGRISAPTPFPEHDVNYDAVTAFKMGALRDAFLAALDTASGFDWDAVEQFATVQASWIEDYARFMAFKEHFGGGHWLEWPEQVRARNSDAVDALARELKQQIEYHRFTQFVFRAQWKAIKHYANERSIAIVGDIPIYVAADSADVWSNQREFRLRPDGSPSVVSGVPPDYFSEDGQRWGNPLFDWRHMASDDFRWWTLRVEKSFELVDIVRIDHFRGFAAGWVIPEHDVTARGGRWERGPGRSLFEALERSLGARRYIVEDLGLITRDVTALRQSLNLPGMSVLQFAFDGSPHNRYLPHNYERNCVVYTGTHDNQTTVAWFQGLSDASRRHVQTYIGNDGSDISWELGRLALESIADVAIIPLQDIMRLGDESRMNTPGVSVGNWRWRYQEHQLHRGLADGLKEISHAYGRNVALEESGLSDPFDYGSADALHRLHEEGA